jgi:hypothetical protein
MQIFIKLPKGNHIVLNVNNNTRVDNLKKLIFKKTGLPSTWQSLLFNGKSMDDINNLLSYYNIIKESTIIVKLKFHGVGCRCHYCTWRHILLRNGKRL